ncbi:MAG: DUF5683 domain-containing protein [Candidatus Neomarinimicrobiota bacterium]|nr:DUF5683 domain-containing protein [Candidatus Neomarinimicrobiota bacterium]
MIKKKFFLHMAIFLSLPITLLGQDTRQTVAVLDFEGRGISQLEAQTLTDRFRTALGSAGALRLVERQMVQEVLQEQGFQQTGCTSDECAVEVGQLLGVQNMIGGAIGRVGRTFTIDMRMFSVQTGENIRTKNVSYAGAVDGLITEIEILAYEISGLKAPAPLLAKRKAGAPAQPIMAAPRKTHFGAMIRSIFIPGMGQFYSERRLWGYTWLLSELAIAGGIYTFGTQWQTSKDSYNTTIDLYNNETDPDMIREYKAEAQGHHADMDAAATQAETLAYAAAGIWAVNVLHALITGPKKDGDENKKTSSISSPVQLVFDPNSRATMMSFTIPIGR